MKGMRFVSHLAVPLESRVEIGGFPVSCRDKADDCGSADIVAFFSVSASGESDREQFFERI